jgi:hypothetical protein
MATHTKQCTITAEEVPLMADNTRGTFLAIKTKILLEKIT